MEGGRRTRGRYAGVNATAVRADHHHHHHHHHRTAQLFRDGHRESETNTNNKSKTKTKPAEQTPDAESPLKRKSTTKENKITSYA